MTNGYGEFRREARGRSRANSLTLHAIRQAYVACALHYNSSQM